MAKRDESKATYQPKYVKPQVTELLKAAIRTEQEMIAPFNVRERRIKFDRIYVNTFGDAPSLNIEPECDREYYKKWQLDAGKFFIRDLKNGNYDKYFEITADMIKAIVRQLTQEEVDSKEYSKFQHFTIGGFTYIIIKAINIDGSYCYNDCNTELIVELNEDGDKDVDDEDGIDVDDEDDGYSDNIIFESIDTIDDDCDDDYGIDAYNDNND